MPYGVLCFLALGVLCGCLATPAEAPDLRSFALAELPRPVTNNAVAGVQHNNRVLLFSFLGLGAGKTWRDTRSEAWMLELHHNKSKAAFVAERWARIPDVPGPFGRLASTAVSIKDKVYVFGGYTVAEDGSEKSVPLVHMFDPATYSYTELKPMPVPVDDTVSLVYENRYVYLISGWHDTDNVHDVQVYDAHKNNWFSASAFPGPAVFGHAGGIVDNKMLVCDGVKVLAPPGGKRKFVASPVCYVGVIDIDHPEIINWKPVAHYPDASRYRMAAGAAGGRIYLAGGSDNPYNYDGIGYDGVASKPSAAVYAYDLEGDVWSRARDLPFVSMDHRGLIRLMDGFALPGGMGEAGKVLSRVIFYSPE